MEHEEPVREGVDVAAMLEGVEADVGELRERRYFPFVAAFVALFGAATLVTAGRRGGARVVEAVMTRSSPNARMRWTVVERYKSYKRVGANVTF